MLKRIRRNFLHDVVEPLVGNQVTRGIGLDDTTNLLFSGLSLVGLLSSPDRQVVEEEDNENVLGAEDIQTTVRASSRLLGLDSSTVEKVTGEPASVRFG